MPKGRYHPNFQIEPQWALFEMCCLLECEKQTAIVSFLFLPIKMVGKKSQRVINLQTVNNYDSYFTSKKIYQSEHLTY